MPRSPAPTSPLQPIPAVRPAPRVGRLLVVGLIALGLAALGVASQVTSQSNAGTIKVHDGIAADPATRNEPHVTGDAYVEGFNMAAEGGDLLFYSWPPTGDMRLVLATAWTSDDGEPANHFLAGPFDLPCGHYRVFAYNGLGPEDATEPQPGGAKKKTFWVEPCDAAGEPTPTPTPTPGPAPNPSLECPPGLTATPLGDGSVRLAWTPAAGSDGTNVYRADGDGDFEYLATVTAGGGFVDATASAGGAYAYLVTAFDGAQESQGCAIVEVTAIPDFPTMAGAGLALGGSLLAFGLASRRKA